MARLKPFPEYQAWVDMWRRCSNKSDKTYVFYGERGITVCERWRSFKAFFEDMGNKPEGYWLERIENNKGYYPENCKWATPKEQARNRRQTANVSVRGQTLCVRDACKLLKINEDRVYSRVRNRAGVSHQQAIETICQLEGINV